MRSRRWDKSPYEPHPRTHPPLGPPVPSLVLGEGNKGSGKHTSEVFRICGCCQSGCIMGAGWVSKSIYEVFLKAMLGDGDKKPYGNGDGKVSLKELKRYLDKEMTYLARRYYGRDQNAQITVDGRQVLVTKWDGLCSLHHLTPHPHISCQTIPMSNLNATLCLTVVVHWGHSIQ